MNDEELLEHLVQEARAEQGPAIDMAALEARVIERVTSNDAPRFTLPPPRSRRAPVLVALGLAAAAAAALLIGVPAAHRGNPLAIAPTAPTAAATPRAEALDAGATGRSLERPGFASLWLAPSTRGTLREESQKLSFLLDEGAVSLDVRPQPAPDRVEVIAGNVRVSVKGTRFRVTRHGDQVEVDVEHGAVQVASLGAPHTFAPVLLRGPAAGSFAPGAEPVMREPVAFSVTPALPIPGSPAASAPSAAPATSVAAPSATTTHHPPRTSPPASANNATEQELRSRSLDLASSCLSSSSSVAPGVSVTIDTVLSIEADAAGKISSFAFNPPLAPAVEQCFRSGKGQLRGPAGRFSIPLSLSLGTR